MEWGLLAVAVALLLHEVRHIVTERRAKKELELLAKGLAEILEECQET